MGSSDVVGIEVPSVIDLCVADVRPSEFAYFNQLVVRWCCPYIALSARNYLVEAIKKGDSSLADKILCRWGVRGEDGAPALSCDTVWDAGVRPYQNAPAPYYKRKVVA